MYTPNEPTPGLPADSLDGAIWRKSSHSGTQGNCVEVATNLPSIVAVRDSKDPDGALLIVSRAAWTALIAGIRNGQPSPTGMLATCRPAPGLTSDTVPSSSLATQTSPPPTVTPAGPRPTGMRSLTCPAGSTRSRRSSAASVTHTAPPPAAIPFRPPTPP